MKNKVIKVIFVAGNFIPSFPELMIGSSGFFYPYLKYSKRPMNTPQPQQPTYLLNDSVMSNALCCWGNLYVLFARKISGATYKTNFGALIQLWRESAGFPLSGRLLNPNNQKRAECLLTVLTLDRFPKPIQKYLILKL